MVGQCMKIIDISMNIAEDMEVYKNIEKKKPKIIQKQSRYVTEHDLEINLHTGTHIDAPYHMILNGNKVNDYELSRFITDAKVFEIRNVKYIEKKDLAPLDIEEGDTVILKTENSYNHDLMNFVFLKESGAQYLLDKKINAVGIDTLGIERSQDNHPTHKLLLSNDIIIIEGLYLKNVNEGKYKLIFLPIKIKGVEASFTRAVLLDEFSNEI